jgi:hypothetical protein
VGVWGEIACLTHRSGRIIRLMSSRFIVVMVSLAATGVFACGSSVGIHPADGGSGSGGRPASGGSGGRGGSGGSGVSGSSGRGGEAGEGGAAGALGCGTGMQGSAITDCGYPTAGGGPLASVVFNESEVLRAIQPSGGSPVGIVRVFYNDEHALTLGVSQVVVKTAAGDTMTSYPVSPLAMSPGSAIDPKTGTTELAGDQSGLDPSLRPMWPALFITDITNDPNSRVGDWQQGGRPRGPNAVFGSWKGAIRTVDKTVTPNKVTITPEANPAKNHWDLAGGDPVPAGLTDQGFGAEARWDVPLVAGHSYRLQVIVHDGDQTRAGGDSGEACVIFCAGGAGGAGGSGGYMPPPSMCPTGVMSCGAGGVDPKSCPAGTVCANGCCLIIVP